MLKTLLFLSLLVGILYLIQTLRLAYAISHDERSSFISCFIAINKAGFSRSHENPYAIEVLAHLYLMLTGLYLFHHHLHYHDEGPDDADYYADYHALEVYMNRVLFPSMMANASTHREFQTKLKHYLKLFKTGKINDITSTDRATLEFQKIAMLLNLPDHDIQAYCIERLAQVKGRPLNLNTLQLMIQQNYP